MSAQKHFPTRNLHHRPKFLSKPQSITTQTRLSQSHVFNNSHLQNQSKPQTATQNLKNMKTTNEEQSIPKTHANQYLSNNIHNSENRQVQFLRIKNGQLTQNNRRLEQHVRDLEEQKKQLLQMNKKYIDVVNRHYQNQNKQFEEQSRVGKDRNYRQAHVVLLRLEKDHRNLVKHCLVMEEEIKNYQCEMEKFNIMKQQLRALNHVTIHDVGREMEDLTHENKNLKKHNNQITFELEKAKAECFRLRKSQGIKEQQAGNSENQIAKIKSQMNTIKQQSIDSTNTYQAKIYDLQIKVEKLQSQLRGEQQYVTKAKSQHKQLSMKHVENVHEYDKLQQSLSQLLSKQKNLTRARGLSHNSKNKNLNLTFVEGMSKNRKF